MRAGSRGGKNKSCFFSLLSGRPPFPSPPPPTPQKPHKKLIAGSGEGEGRDGEGREGRGGGRGRGGKGRAFLDLLKSHKRVLTGDGNLSAIKYVCLILDNKRKILITFFPNAFFLNKQMKL